MLAWHRRTNRPHNVLKYCQTTGSLRLSGSRSSSFAAAAAKIPPKTCNEAYMQWSVSFVSRDFIFWVSVIKIVKRDEKITGLIVNWARYELLLLGYSVRNLFRTTICDAKRTFLSRRDSWLHFLSLHYHINDKIIQHQFTNQVSSMTQVFFLYFCVSFHFYQSFLSMFLISARLKCHQRLQITIFNSITEELIVNSYFRRNINCIHM